MTDLTLLYYTANTIEETLGNNVRQHLLSIKGDLPIVSVSQKPLDFGENYYIGDIGRSYYNCYKQILTGAYAVKTLYVACCEDDTLYHMEQFNHRPSSEKVFSYNKNMWYCEETEFWTRGWTGMLSCIVGTEYLIETLKKRFERYPEEIHYHSGRYFRTFQEPGRFDKAHTEYWSSKEPLVTFNYFGAMGGKAKCVAQKPKTTLDLKPWGDCWDLKKKYWGKAKPRKDCPPKYGNH